MELTVRINDEFKLYAGSVAFVGDGNDRRRVITPPAATMFEQILCYLDAKPLPAHAFLTPTSLQEGIAALAVCLRWGSYFAVLADKDKPLWHQARSRELRGGVSRISDSEMARINVESSAAMSAWIDIFHQGPRGRYSPLVAKALEWLPMPQYNVKSHRNSAFLRLAQPQYRQRLIDTLEPDQRAVIMAELEIHATRVFSNALVNYGWRNGPIEDAHAGRATPDLPLDKCRIASTELGSLIRYSATRFQAGMEACHLLWYETPMVSWAEQVLPFSLAEEIGVTPFLWTLTAASREVHEFLPDSP